MTTPIGPRGPHDLTLGSSHGSSHGRVLPFPRRPGVDGAAGPGAQAPASPAPVSSAPVSSVSVASPSEPSPAEPTRALGSTSTFERTAGQSTALAAPVDGAGKSQVLARLQAMGVEGRKRVKTAEPSRVVAGADGRVHDGPLTIESRAGLSKLEGVTRLAGSLTLAEGAVKNADLLALRDLKVIEGRLTFEGMRNA